MPAKSPDARRRCLGAIPGRRGRPTNPYSHSCLKSKLIRLGLATLLLVPTLLRAQQVTTTADSGPGSLRSAISSAAANATLNFAPGLSGQTIALTSGELQLGRNLTIDASALPAGIRINGNHASRVIEVSSGATVFLNSLTITNGYASAGGGILNKGTLTINRCTIAGNSVASGGGGGGIYNNLGVLTLNECTVAGNSAAVGGGAGGGIFNLSGGAPVTLNHCTVAGNSANTGGGFDSFNFGPANVSTLAIFNSILAGNSGASSPDLANGTTSQTGANLIGGDPLLASLGNHGGPTPTMPPLPGSPAIDLGNDSGAGMFTTDQRGFPRRSGSHVDIGAVELQAPVVTTTADSGLGSLRAVVTLPVELPVEAGGFISFATNLSGQTILLTSGELLLTNNLGIDASALAGGVTLSGGNASRVFNVSAGASVNLVGLTITQGKTTNVGGAIYSAAGSTLHLARCTVTGSSGLAGGALLNEGLLQAENCTFTGNGAGSGGALQCRAPTTLTHCTIFGNNAPAGGSGVFNQSTLTLNNCIIAGNTGPAQRSDIYSQLAALVYTNPNLIPSIIEDRPSAADIGPAPMTSDPLLAPLSNYGGPTLMMPPLLGSPAIDAGGPTGLLTDQRGFPRVIGPAPDLGAAEFCLDNPVVTTNADAGLGSLRYSVLYGRPGTTITFAAALSGQTVLLTHGQMLLDRDLTIDAFSLPRGIQINGNWGSRLFYVQTNATVLMSSLSLVNGLAQGSAGTNAPDSFSGPVGVTGGDGTDGLGGGIYNAGNLTLDRTSVSNHSAVGGAGGQGGMNRQLDPSLLGGQGGAAGRGAGGGIYNAGSLLLNRSTLSGNSATGGQGGNGGAAWGDHGGTGGGGGNGQGGGIYNAGTLTLSETTLSGDQAAGGDGGRGSFSVSFPTSYGLPGDGGNGFGGAIYNAGTLAINQSTLALDAASGGAHGYSQVSTTSTPGTGQGGGIYSDNTFSLLNSIIAGNKADSAVNILGAFTTTTTNLTSGDPLLAPLGNYGGPTQTMPPLPGSPAIDAADNPAAIPFGTDQRGLPRFSGVGADLGAVEVQLAGQPFPLNGGVTRLGNGALQFNFANLPGGSFTVLASTNAASPANAWWNLGLALEVPPGSGLFQFIDPQATNYPQRFYRVRSP